MPEAHQKASDYQPQDTMYLWWVANPESPTLIGELNLVNRGHGVSLSYAPQWLQNGVPLSEDLPLQARLFLPEKSDTAAGAVDDARPDRWGERVIGALDEPKRLSLLEYLYFAGDHRFGALGVSLRADACVPAPLSAPLSALPTLSEVGRIHDILMKVAAGEPVDEREKRLINPGRSMGGAKPKSLV